MEVNHLKVLASLRRLEARADGDAHASVAVGFNGVAALKLHEMTPKHLGEPRRARYTTNKKGKRVRVRVKNANVRGGKGVYWGPSLYGNKFLEGPARKLSNSGETRKTVFDALAGGARLLQALYLGGLGIQRDAMLATPYEIGELSRSAFTTKE